MPVYKGTFEGRVEQLPMIRDFVETAAGELGAGEEDRFACQLVVDEAATNSFEHSYHGEAGRVEVSLWREGDYLLLSVRNWGEPFEPEEIPVPDVMRPLEQRSAGGLGLFLIRKFTEGVDFEFDPEKGNSVTMRRRLTGAGEGGGVEAE